MRAVQFNNRECLHRHLGFRNFEEVGSHDKTTKLLDRIAREAGITLLQLALAWLMANPRVTAPIIGPRDREQLKANLSALEVELDAETLAAVDKVVAPGEAVLRF